MKVLVLGFARTGTQSLANALELFGYKGVYHMREVGQNDHQDFWIAALNAKLKGEGKIPGREEFDGVLGSYEALSDLPAAAFYEELCSMYPDAKVILTTRAEDKWYESMKATLIHAWARPERQASLMKGLSDALQLLWKNDFEKHGIECFRAHNSGVMAAASQGQSAGGDINSRLLVYEVKEGWEPLCKFLSKDVPSVAFPRADDWHDYKQAHSEAK